MAKRKNEVERAFEMLVSAYVYLVWVKGERDFKGSSSNLIANHFHFVECNKQSWDRAWKKWAFEQNQRQLNLLSRNIPKERKHLFTAIKESTTNV